MKWHKNHQQVKKAKSSERSREGHTQGNAENKKGGREKGKKGGRKE